MNLTKFESQQLPNLRVYFLVIFASNYFKRSDNTRPEAVDDVEFVEVGLVDCHG